MTRKEASLASRSALSILGFVFRVRVRVVRAKLCEWFPPV